VIYLLSALFATLPDTTIVVDTAAEFVAAARESAPGTKIELKPGDYRGGIHLSALNGTAQKPIIITSQNPANPARIVGGSSGLQFSSISHIVVSDIVIQDASGNGLNIDDGGRADTPAHHVVLRNITVRRLPSGNRDGIKLSGLTDFRVENCTVERWGGSAIDMVGCHRGIITDCLFTNGGDNGVQMKGGSSLVTVRRSQFLNAGQRALNLGGSTGREFFRPPLRPGISKNFEAKDLRVEHCVVVGGVAAFAFVGVNGAVVENNTIYDPERWVVRILQETNAPDFMPSQGGVFRNNIVAYRASRWASDGINIGGGTAPETFRFDGNVWWGIDHSARPRPPFPFPQRGEMVGTDPRFENAANGNFKLRSDSPVLGKGANFTSAFRRDTSRG